MVYYSIFSYNVQSAFRLDALDILNIIAAKKPADFIFALNDMPLNFKADMRHVYFDVAGFPLQKQLHAPLKDVKVENLLYGSDTPYTPNIACIALSGGLESISGLSEEDKNKLFTENAIRLIPRLADVLGIEVHGKSVCYRDMPLTTREKIGRGLRALVSKVYNRIFS